MDLGTLVAIICGACIGLAFVLCFFKECCNNDREPEFVPQPPDPEAVQVEGQPYQAAPRQGNNDKSECCLAVGVTCMLCIPCDN
jgi:hypothetical protein